MSTFTAYAFVDGAYLRKIAGEADAPWVDPYQLASLICRHNEIRSLAAPHGSYNNCQLLRTLYYDACPDDPSEPLAREVIDYMQQVELLPETHLGFGFLRGNRPERLRQKGVDTLLAVDMLVGAVDKLFDVAILVSGDADFVPVVREVSRRGVTIVLAAQTKSMSDDLRRCADRFVPIGPDLHDWFPKLKVGDRTWGK